MQSVCARDRIRRSGEAWVGTGRDGVAARFRQGGGPSAALAAVAALALVASGCHSVNPKASFGDVAQTVADRGGPRIRWMLDEAAAAEVDARVQELLKLKLTAQTAAEIALLNNRRLQAGFEDIGVSQAELARASRLHNPTFAASWRLPSGGPGTVNSDYGLAANFLDLLTLPARRRIALRNLEIAKQRVAQEVLLFSEEVETAFYTLAARRQFALRLERVADVNEAAADIAQRQFKAGNITVLELKLQQLAREQVRLDLARAEAETRAHRERLNRLMGLSGGRTSWEFDEKLPELPEEEVPVAEIEAIAVGRRLDLAAARGETEAIAHAIRLKKGVRFLPGVRVGIDAERDPDRLWVLGPTLELELPVFDQGQPELSKLASEYRRSLRRMEALEVDIRSEVREARDALVAAREAAKHQAQTLLPLHQQLLSETLLRYNAMQSGNYDLLLAKQREQQAEQAAIEALRDYWIARARLRTLAGGALSPPGSAPVSPAVPARKAAESPAPASVGPGTPPSPSGKTSSP